MVNSSSSASLIVAAAALLISFVCPPEIVNVGLVFVDDVILNPLPFRTCVATTREILIKEKIFLALATLGLNGQQSVLVQFWSPTKAGNTCLLSTCPSFGYYGTDKGLLVYRRGCLHHAFYIHPEENVCFGLPGRAFMEGTPQQTQDVHDYPVDQRPLCEDNAIFSMKWGSIAVPVILDAECVGVLEFVMTGPTGRYDELMNEVFKALEFSGFQSSLKLETSRVADDFNQYWDCGVSEMSWEQTPTMEPSALGLPEGLHAFVREFDEMKEDQDDVGVHDQGRFNDILVSFE